MKIISKWRDYYDHVAHMYGGGDPKVIYERDYVVPDIESFGSKHEETLLVKGVWSPSIPHAMDLISAGRAPVQKIEFNALVVMDRVFIIERQSDVGEMGVLTIHKDWHITTRLILDLPYGGIYPLMRDGEEFTNYARRFEKTRMRDLIFETKNNGRHVWKQGSKYNGLKKLCEFAKAPVFIVHGNRMPIIMGRTPKLSALGLPAYIDPQQLYQELAMFVGNVLKPIEQPTSNMKDIEKVTSHGFDKKVSFRNRK